MTHKISGEIQHLLAGRAASMIFFRAFSCFSLLKKLPLTHCRQTKFFPQKTSLQFAKSGKSFTVSKRFIQPVFSGRSAAWLARLTGGQKVASSNLAVPTIFEDQPFGVTAERLFRFLGRNVRLSCFSWLGLRRRGAAFGRSRGSLSPKASVIYGPPEGRRSRSRSR